MLSLDFCWCGMRKETGNVKRMSQIKNGIVLTLGTRNITYGLGWTYWEIRQHPINAEFIIVNEV